MEGCMASVNFATEWRSRGACLTADPDLFFPISQVGPGRLQISQAKAVCGKCAVREECLSFALEMGLAEGVWGGTSPEERRRLSRSRAA